MRIIAHDFRGNWLAWFDDGSPDTFGGPDAFAVIGRLLENSPARHLTLDDFEPDLAECRLNRVVIVLIDRDCGCREADSSDRVRTEPCPECGGIGKYVGLRNVDPCTMCRGLGRVSLLTPGNVPLVSETARPKNDGFLALSSIGETRHETSRASEIL